MLHVFSFSTLIVVFLAIAPAYSLAWLLPQQQNVSSGEQSHPKGIKNNLEIDPNLKIKKNYSEAGLSRELEQEVTNLAHKEASGRLTAEEVVEFVSVYTEHFFQTRPPSAQKASPRADSGH